MVMNSNKVVVGLQWGDEGKGKIVDWLSENADAVIRFQGGHNAGHTLVIGDQTFKLSLLPSGIVRHNTVCMIGQGVVVDPVAFETELTKIQNAGIKVDRERLLIAYGCPLVLSFHRDLDQQRELAAGKNKIGTTGRGIGPAYEDKVARRAIRAGDITSSNLKDRVQHCLTHHNVLRRGMGLDMLDVDQITREIQSISRSMVPFLGPVGERLEHMHQQGKKLLFEGAQGTLLDVDCGTYPFVTSSNTVAPQAMLGSGLGVMQHLDVLGIFKAYTTRVGQGPFPTEQSNDMGELLGQRGHEFGTVTGRKRRCGWLDLPLLRHAVRMNGCTELGVMKLDVLDTLDEIHVCVAYHHLGKRFDTYPYTPHLWNEVEPVYQAFPGWKTDTTSIKQWADLPSQAQHYISFIEDFVGVPIRLVSVGPERTQTIQK